MDQLLLLPCPRVLACSWWGPAAAIPQASLQRFAAARTVGKSQVPGSVALATTSRRVSRPSFCGGERCCRCRWCCCPALLDFSCVGRLGTLAAAASPMAKPTVATARQPRQDTVLFLSCLEAQKLCFQRRGPLRCAAWPFSARGGELACPVLAARALSV